jgi:hypothetical protein
MKSSFWVLAAGDISFLQSCAAHTMHLPREAMTLQVGRGMLFSGEFWKKQVCSGKTLL